MSEMNTSRSSAEVKDICTPYNTLPLEDDETASRWFYNHFDAFIYIIFLPILAVLGLAGNGAFLFMISRLSRMKTMVNLFLVNLAVNDIVFLTCLTVYCIAMYLLSPLSLRHPFDNTHSCLIVSLVFFSAYYCSISIVTLVSVERFYAVCHPLRQLKMQNTYHAFKPLSVAYLISIILAVVTSLRRSHITEFCLKWPQNGQYENMPNVFRYCGPLSGINVIEAAMEILFSVLFFLAAFINGILYIKIIFTLRSRPLIQSSSKECNALVRNQVTRALVINGILFFLTQLPMRIHDIDEILAALDQPAILSPKQKANLNSFASMFLGLNSAMNPFVYTISSSNYRQGFRDAFSFLLKTSKKKQQTLDWQNNQKEGTSKI